MTPRLYARTRTLPPRPDLHQLKRQAKELLKAFAAGDAAAVAEVNAHYQGALAESFALHDAQLVLARSYGFPSWPKMKAFVDGITVGRLVDAIRAGDLKKVRSMVRIRPELVHVDVGEDDEHRALHHAVLARQPEIVRFLMRHGAHPRKGIYPYRDATDALTLAAERGFTDLVEIMREEECRRTTKSPLTVVDEDVLAEMNAALRRDDENAMTAVFEAHPALVHTANSEGMTPLHWASACLWPRMAAWLLDHEADANARANGGETPLDVVGHWRDDSAGDRAHLSMSVGQMLIARGAEPTARWAVAVGDAAWLQARHAEGALNNESGLVTEAVRANRPDILTLLLDLGLDPDEAGRVGGLEEVVPTFGGPLRECARLGRRDLAEILLSHGANPNTNVYAASSAVDEAHSRKDEAMIALLERYGGRLSPGAAASLGGVAQAARLLDDEAVSGTVAEELLSGAIARPSPEIVRLALDRIDWPRDDPRWYSKLENALYVRHDPDRALLLAAFRLILNRCDPNVPGSWGTTILHAIAASRGDLTADDRLSFAVPVLDAGGRLDVRDNLLKSTPLGWACRWGRIELVRLFLERGADPIEADAEPWTTPRAWAEKMNHADVLAMLP
jgi:ankyrin repeat protein